MSRNEETNRQRYTKKKETQEGKATSRNNQKEPKGPKAVPKQTPPTQLMTLASTYICTYLTRLTHPCISSTLLDWQAASPARATGRRGLEKTNGRPAPRSRHRRRNTKDRSLLCRPPNLTNLTNHHSGNSPACRAGRRLIVASEQTG